MKIVCIISSTLSYIIFLNIIDITSLLDYKARFVFDVPTPFIL